MPNQFLSTLSFSGGICTLERPDLQRYQSSVRELVNWTPSSYGYLTLRDGMVIANTEMPIGTIWRGKLIPITPTVGNTAFLSIPTNPVYRRAFDETGNTLELNDVSAIFTAFAPCYDPLKIKSACLNNLSWHVSPDFHPVQAQRTDAGFDVNRDFFTNPPLNAENTDESYVITKVSGDLTTHGSTVIFSYPSTNAYNPFYDADKNAYTAGLKLSYSRKVAQLKGSLNVDATSDSFFCLGEWTFQTEGKWRAYVEVQRKLLDKADRQWETVWSQRTLKPEADIASNFTHSSTEPIACLLRVVVSDRVYAEGVDMYTLSVANTDEFCYVRVIGEVEGSPNQYECVVLQPMAQEVSPMTFYKWSEFAFSARHGYPNAVGIHLSRLWFGGTKTRPQTLWASAVDRFSDFHVSSLDDSALDVDVAGSTTSDILWMQTGQVLAIGTSGGEYILTTLNNNQALTPSNIRVSLQSAYGSSQVQGLTIGNGVAYLSTEGQRLRYMTFEFASDVYESIAMSDFAHGTLGTGVTTATVGRSPENTWYGVRNDGTVCGMVYNKTQKVTAWFRWEFPFEVYDMCAVAQENAEDTIWVVSKDGRVYKSSRGYNGDVVMPQPPLVPAVHPVIGRIETLPFVSPNDGMDALCRVHRVMFKGEQTAIDTTNLEGVQHTISATGASTPDTFLVTEDGKYFNQLYLESQSDFEHTVSLTSRAVDSDNKYISRINSLTFVLSRNIIP